MNKENTEKLFTEFPLLYAGKDKSIQENLMPFGFECDDGWMDIIYNLSVELEPLIQKWIDENGAVEYYPMAMQVKEKFGGLRFYMTFETNEMRDLIYKAEDGSYRACETCGTKENVFSTKGWIRITCQECEDKRMENRKKYLVNKKEQ